MSRMDEQEERAMLIEKIERARLIKKIESKKQQPDEKATAEGFDLSTAAEPEDTVLENTADVAGEVAAGANSTLLAIPDAMVDLVNMIISGNRGALKLATGGTLNDAVATTREQPIPNVSDVVEMGTGYRPGVGGFMEPGLARGRSKGSRRGAGSRRHGFKTCCC